MSQTSMFLFDTDHIVIMQQRAEPEFNRLSLRMSRYRQDLFFTPIVSFHEQVLGWNSFLARAVSSSTKVVRAYEKFEQILADFAGAQLASFDADAAVEFESLRRKKVRIGTMDLRIASIALAREYTVLSRNLIDFERVPGLVVEDWAKT